MRYPPLSLADLARKDVNEQKLRVSSYMVLAMIIRRKISDGTDILVLVSLLNINYVCQLLTKFDKLSTMIAKHFVHVFLKSMIRYRYLVFSYC